MEAKIHPALSGKEAPSISGDINPVKLGEPLRCLVRSLIRPVLLAVAIQLLCISIVYAQERVLVPRNTITGGRLASQIDSSGFPLTDSLQEFQPLAYPAVLAVRAPDFYIADSGAHKIYRYDPDQQIISVVPDISASIRTRLQIGLDQTLFVLAAGESTILRFDRAGKLLDSFSDPLDTARLGEFIVKENSGQILATDHASRGLVTIGPGRAPLLLSAASEGDAAQLGALAGTGGDIYAIDKKCSCIAVLDEWGKVRDYIGQGTMAQPSSVAVDRYGYLFVADASNKKLWVYLHGRQIAAYEARKLHVDDISAMAVDEGTLYIADGPGGKVVSLYIRPPKEMRQ